jgi:hypothetical protein
MAAGGLPLGAEAGIGRIWPWWRLCGEASGGVPEPRIRVPGHR